MIKLSICIATYNRERYIGETLDSILIQMQPSVELIVVDGASPDATETLMRRYMALHPQIRYYREEENSGIDGDYDKAVGYARGEYCWLMTDDDLICPEGIARVLQAIDGGQIDLVVVNSEVRNPDFTKVLSPCIVSLPEDRSYSGHENDCFMAQVASYLSFIGAVVIRREMWLSRNRKDYYGTGFVHVGVIFQHPPVSRIRVIAQPQIIIRYGNASWTSRYFEIWMFQWPTLIWSFPDFSETSKRSVCRYQPWRSPLTLLYQRALGAYSPIQFHRFIAPRSGVVMRLVSYAISLLPISLLNTFALCYCILIRKKDWIEIFDLVHSSYANAASRWLARVFLKSIA